MFKRYQIKTGNQRPDFYSVQTEKSSETEFGLLNLSTQTKVLLVIATASKVKLLYNNINQIINFNFTTSPFCPVIT